MWNEDRPSGERDDADEFHSTWTIRDAVPTRAHAEMLFDQVADLLGDSAWIDSYAQGKRRLLFRRDAPGADSFIPWPILSLGMGGRLSTVVMISAPEGAPLEPPPRPGRAPRIRGLGPGEILVHDGPQSITITYGEDGRWMETTRGGPPQTLAGAIAALATKTAQPVELLAQFVAGLDVARHGPGRVVMPVPLPGVRNLWTVGLPAIRHALFTDRVPRDARWAVVDGYAGEALAWGATREAALSAWRAEVERVRPRPPMPVELPPNLPQKDAVETSVEGDRLSIRVTARAPEPDVAVPTPAVENTPAVIVPIAEFPARAPAVGAWTRLLGAHGATVHAALRRDVDGFTLLGDRLLAVAELEDLEHQLDVADIDYGARPRHVFERPAWMPPPPVTDNRVLCYRVVDETTGTTVAPCVVSGATCVGFHAGNFDGEQLRWFAVRQRWERG